MIVHHEQVEEGLFVYQILYGDRIRIRPYPDLDDVEGDKSSDFGGNFEDNELLAVDLIQPTASATFLRLADQSGWVVAAEKGDIYMRQVPVETGLFSFFVDNVPSGLVVRRHPMDDSSDLLTTESNDIFRLEPMQRIYCDAVTQHPTTGVRFYRLQVGGKNAHATPGWVFDRKPEVGDDGPIFYLLEANKVKTGLFAYKATAGCVVRHRPNCSEAAKTSLAVLANEMVVVDIVRESPFNNGNGPFLRLADGSGWLFERKLGVLAMQPVPIASGKWVLSVLNNPVGMKLRKQPVDSQKNTMDTVYSFGDMVECDRRLTNHLGVNFYRVRDSTGWLFDSRDGIPMLCVLSEDVLNEDNDTVVKLPPWHANYVRGIASTVAGTKELSYQSAGQILTFDNADSILVKVFCSSRTVCTIFEHSSKGTVKHFIRDCTIQDVVATMQMDLVESIIAYDKFESEKGLATDEDTEEKKDEVGEIKRSEMVQEEETLRIRLLVCDAEIASIQAKRRELLGLIKVFDDKRAKTAAWMKEATNRHRPIKPAPLLSSSSPPNSPSKHVSHKLPINSTKFVQKRSGGAIVQKVTSNSIVERNYRSLSSSYASSAGEGTSAYFSDDAEDDDEEDDEEDEEETIVTKASRLSVKDDRIVNKRPHVCGECFRGFTGKYSRDIHCRNVHKLFCSKCDKIFPSSRDLEIHRDVMNHW